MIINWNDREGIFDYFSSICKLIDCAGYDASDGYAAQYLFNSLKDGYFQNAPDEIINDKDFLVKMVQAYGRLYRLVPEKYYFDKEILLALLSSGRWNEYYENNGDYSWDSINPFDFIESAELNKPSLFSDKDFALRAVKTNPSFFEYISDKLKHDTDILDVFSHFNNFQMSLLPKDVHIEREIILKAIQKNGRNIEYLPKEYWHDKELLIAAVTENPRSFYSAPETFKKNVNLTIKVIKDYHVSYDIVDDAMWENPKFVLEMAKLYGTKIINEYALDINIFKEDTDFGKKLVSVSPSFYPFLPKKLQKDPEIIKTKKEMEEKAFKKKSHKTDSERSLDGRWDNFIDKLFVKEEMQVEEFQHLFFDTFWYFRNRKDVSVLDVGGWHILSSLSAFRKIPCEFAPSGCRINEFNAARCLCEDLLGEINTGMPGFYGEDQFENMRDCVPPAGCSPSCASMGSFEDFISSFNGVVADFDDFFEPYRSEYYSNRYNMSESYKKQ